MELKGPKTMAQRVKNLPVMQDMQVKSLGQEDPLEILLGKSYGQRRLGNYSPRDHKRVGRDSKNNKKAIKMSKRR